MTYMKEAENVLLHSALCYEKQNNLMLLKLNHYEEAVDKFIMSAKFCLLWFL